MGLVRIYDCYLEFLDQWEKKLVVKMGGVEYVKSFCYYEGFMEFMGFEDMNIIGEFNLEVEKIFLLDYFIVINSFLEEYGQG